MRFDFNTFSKCGMLCHNEEQYEIALTEFKKQVEGALEVPVQRCVDNFIAKKKNCEEHLDYRYEEGVVFAFPGFEWCNHLWYEENHSEMVIYDFEDFEWDGWDYDSSCKRFEILSSILSGKEVEVCST